MLSKTTRFETHASHREDYFAELRTQSIRLHLELGGRHRDRSPANITRSHIDTGDVLLAQGGA